MGIDVPLWVLLVVLMVACPVIGVHIGQRKAQPSGGLFGEDFLPPLVGLAAGLFVSLVLLAIWGWLS